MLAALFIQGGINALKAPEAHAQAAEPVLDAVSPVVDKAVEIAPVDQGPDPEMLIKIDAGVKIAAGSLLALGKFPRLASAALAASLVPTTLSAHRFWEIDDPQEKQAQQVHFLKNVGLLGGLLIAAADTAGKPSLGWRGRRAARLAAATASAQAATLTGAAEEARGRISGSAHEASGRVAGLAAGVAGIAPGAGAAASKRVASKRASGDLSKRVSGDLSKKSAKAARKADKRGAELQRTAGKRGAELQKQAAKRAAELQGKAARKRAELERKAPGVLDQVSTQAVRLGHDVAARASALGGDVAHAAEGVAKDTKKRLQAASR
jgi:uncharacterized membrane protein YphA (DoxX/SURF4 family)